MMNRLHNLTSATAKTSRGRLFVGGFDAIATACNGESWYASNKPALDPQEDSGPTG